MECKTGRLFLSLRTPFSVLYLVRFFLPFAEGLHSFVAHELLCGNRAFADGPLYFFVDEFVAEIDVLCVLLCVGEADAADASPVDGAEAHGAWFAGGVDGAAFELEGMYFLAGGSYGRDFGMSCRVVVGRDSVDAGSYHFSVAHDDGSEGAAAIGYVVDAQVDGLLHEVLVLCGHGGWGLCGQ